MGGDLLESEAAITVRRSRAVIAELRVCSYDWTGRIEKSRLTLREIIEKGGEPMRITLEINLPDSPIDFKTFDEILTTEVHTGMNRVVQQWVNIIEDTQFSRREEKVRKERKEERYLRFTLGDVRINRYKVSTPNPSGGRKYFHPFDRLIGVGDGVSPNLRKRGIELACNQSYAKASEEFSKQRSGSISAAGIHKWVQKVGRGFREEERGRVKRALRPDSKLKAKEQRKALMIEADSTMIPWRKGKGKHFEVKLGLSYSRKKDLGKNGKRRRMIISDKVVVGSVESTEEFGNHLWYSAQRNFGVMDAKVFYQSDGAISFKEIQATHFPGAITQIDTWHIMRKILEACKGDKRKMGELRDQIYRREIDKFLVLVRMYGAVAGREKDAEHWRELHRYVEDNRDLILSFRRFRKEVDEEFRNLLVTGTGAMEKNIDIVICHRFKKRGMKWSKGGAGNLLALRILKMNPIEWNRWWKN